MTPRPPACTIRTALPSDHLTLKALQWRASLGNPGDREALLAHPDAVDIPLGLIESGGVFAAESPSAILGFAAMVVRSDGELELDALFVDPPAWHQGVGRALVAHCCDAARDKGARILHVIGNPHAEGFYTSCGFELIRRQEMQLGVGLVMQRWLS